MIRKLAVVAGLLLVPSVASAQAVVTSITDAALVAGITAARQAYCAAQPATDEDGKPKACPITTNSAYMQMVVEQAAASYARQFSAAEQAKAVFLQTLSPTKRAAVEAELAK